MSSRWPSELLFFCFCFLFFLFILLGQRLCIVLTGLDSLCRPGWLGSHRAPPAPASWVMGLKGCVTTPSFWAASSRWLQIKSVNLVPVFWIMNLSVPVFLSGQDVEARTSRVKFWISLDLLVGALIYCAENIGAKKCELFLWREPRNGWADFLLRVWATWWWSQLRKTNQS